MRYGVASTNFGSYADPTVITRLAAKAEHPGWDAFFVWDHLAYAWNGPTGDPWILLAAAANARMPEALNYPCVRLEREEVEGWISD